MSNELPESVNETLLLGFETQLSKQNLGLEEILEQILSPHLREQIVMTMATWDYWVDQHKVDPRFTKEKLEALNKRIDSVLDE